MTAVCTRLPFGEGATAGRYLGAGWSPSAVPCAKHAPHCQSSWEGLPRTPVPWPMRESQGSRPVPAGWDAGTKTVAGTICDSGGLVVLCICRMIPHQEHSTESSLLGKWRHTQMCPSASGSPSAPSSTARGWPGPGSGGGRSWALSQFSHTCGKKCCLPYGVAEAGIQNRARFKPRRCDTGRSPARGQLAWSLAPGGPRCSAHGCSCPTLKMAGSLCLAPTHGAPATVPCAQGAVRAMVLYESAMPRRQGTSGVRVTSPQEWHSFKF